MEFIYHYWRGKDEIVCSIGIKICLCFLITLLRLKLSNWLRENERMNKIVRNIQLIIICTCRDKVTLFQSVMEEQIFFNVNLYTLNEY